MVDMNLLFRNFINCAGLMVGILSLCLIGLCGMFVLMASALAASRLDEIDDPWRHEKSDDVEDYHDSAAVAALILPVF